MGGSYGSIQVRTQDRDAVLSAVKTLANADQQFLVGPELDGWVGVYPSGSGQDVLGTAELAALLPMPLIHLLVHHDDFFAYEAYAAGEPLDSYNSHPDYFEPVDDAEREQVRGRPELLLRFAPSLKPHAVAELLEAGRQGEWRPAYRLLERFAALLGIRNAVTSFEYLKRGEREDIVGWRSFTPIPDLRAEARAAAKAVKAAWADLERRGVITLRDDQIQVKSVFAAADGTLFSARGGTPFLDRRLRVHGRLEQWSAPWSKPEPLAEGRLDRVHILSADLSGCWLATGHDGQDWGACVWDRASGSLAFEIKHSQMVGWTGFTADSKHVVTFGRELIVTDVATAARVGEYSQMGGRTAVIDDSRSLVAVVGWGLAILELPRATVVREMARPSHWGKYEASFAACLDGSGDHLVIATSEGLHVYIWSALVDGSSSALTPVHSVSAEFTYTVALDPRRGRVLYGGIDGTLAALDLNSGKARTLLTLPGATAIYQLACAPGGDALAMHVMNRPDRDGKRWSGLVVVDLEKLD